MKNRQQIDLLRFSGSLSVSNRYGSSSGAARRCAVYATCAALLAWCSIAAHATVHLPAVIGSNMVVQRSTKVPIWGTADPGEVVTVSIAGSKISVTADSSGRWKTRIGPFKAGGPFTMTVSGQNTIHLDNIMVGEVWLCSGQSNMAMAMDPDLPIGAGGIFDARTELANANFPDIRLFEVKRVVAGTPQRDTAGAWVETTPRTVATFSAVGYLFARELYQHLHVPIGIIEAAWGGTTAQAWTSREALESNPQLSPLVMADDQLINSYDASLDEFVVRLKVWQPIADAAEAKGEVVPAPPHMPYDPRSDASTRVAGLFNGMIAPLVPFAIRGVIWYQGESNATAPEQYRILFPALIRDWRHFWGEGNFPFIYVQLPNFDPNIWKTWGFWNSNAAKSRWPELREAQLMALGVPNTAMAVTIDIGDPVRIHPQNKQPVAHRLVLGALHLAYGDNEPYSGPIYSHAAVEGNRIRIWFEHVDGGLVAHGPKLAGFEIAGSDGQFFPADARIKGSTIVVSNTRIQMPVAARYAWANNPTCNLYNRADLPASPFRTNPPH